MTDVDGKRNRDARQGGTARSVNSMFEITIVGEGGRDCAGLVPKSLYEPRREGAAQISPRFGRLRCKFIGRSGTLSKV